MLAGLRHRLTYANVTATVALFLALGGGAYAAISLPKNSVGTKQLRKRAVTTSKIANGAVATSRVAKAAITSRKLARNSVGGTTIKPGAITPDKLHADPAPTPVVGPAADCAADTSVSGKFCAPWGPYPASQFSSPAYYRDARGVVHLDGEAFSSPNQCSYASTPTQRIFRLPVRDRPATAHAFAVASGNIYGRVDVRKSGEVDCVIGDSAVGVVLDGVAFRAGT